MGPPLNHPHSILGTEMIMTTLVYCLTARVVKSYPLAFTGFSMVFDTVITHPIGLA